MTKRQLQTLTGKLIWAANVHPWGKAFMVSFFHATGMLMHPHHKIRISRQMLADLQWWVNCLSTDMHVRPIWDRRSTVTITTDSSSVGAGGFCVDSGDICYCNWTLDKPYLANAHIGYSALLLGTVGTRLPSLAVTSRFTLTTL